MSRKRYSPEKIIGMLREAEVALAKGMTVSEICRRLRKIIRSLDRDNEFAD